MAFRSPAVISMSISRPGRVLDTPSARRRRSSVSLPMADTTTTTPSPDRTLRATWSATARIRSGSPTAVPPNFWTSSATALHATGGAPRGSAAYRTTAGRSLGCPAVVSKVRRPAPSPSRYTNRTRLLAAVLVFILLGSGIAVVLANVGNEPEAEEAFAATDCPTADRSGVPVLGFDRPPPMCIGPSGDYTAVFDTTEGEVKVRLDTDRTPNTVNNFVVLANYGYYDDTLLFRLEPTIAIIQGGSPHTQNWSDQGPGYNIPDEGGLFLPLTSGSVQGPFTYRPGQLVMARSAGLNSSGAQFFFTTGPEVAALDAQGSYIVFGETDAAGLSVLQGIMDLYRVDPGSTYGGGPSREVTVRSVTILGG